MPSNSELSDREIEILRLVATGASNKEIAQELHISTNTVKVHLRNIFGKIGVESRTEAALYAVTAGYVDGLRSSIGEQEKAPTPIITEDILVIEDDTALSPKSSNRPRMLGALLVVALVMIVILLIIRNPGSNQRNSEQTALEIINPTLAPRWQVLAPMLSKRFGFAFVPHENKIYAIGGESDGQVLGMVEVYDISSDKWVESKSKPTPVADISGAVLRGKIYIAGGRLASGAVTDLLEIYDIQEDKWIKGSSLPSPRSSYAIAAYEGRLYLFGGWDGKDVSNKVYEYIPETDQWREKSPMTVARMAGGAVAASGKIYLIGGSDGDQTLKTNDAYSPNLDDLEHNPWESMAPMPSGRSNFGITSLSGIIYVIGGESEFSGGLELLSYFPSSDQWQNLDSQILNVWSQLGVAGIESNIYLAGGNIDGKTTEQSLSFKAIYTVLFPVVK